VGKVAPYWTNDLAHTSAAPWQLRHNFVSLLSDSGVLLEDISRLVGHQNTTVTETVYRHQLRPVIEDAASAMDRIFPASDDQDDDDDGTAGMPAPSRRLAGRLEELAGVDIDPGSSQFLCKLRVPIPTERLVQHACYVRWKLDVLLVKSNYPPSAERTEEESEFKNHILTGTRA